MFRVSHWRLAPATPAAAPAADAAAAVEGTGTKEKRSWFKHTMITRRKGGYLRGDNWGWGQEGPNAVGPLQMQAILHCVDNSNCKHLRLVKEVDEKRSHSRITAAVVHRCALVRFKDDEAKMTHQKLKPGDLMWCVLFARRAQVARKSGLVTSFDKNAAILINDKGVPVGTRVTYAAGRHLNHKALVKAAVMANFLI
jgi:large subunit ribosomal protein L14